ncbi:hypothetical protein LPJ56_000793 [Coemansia sp. RSA 2599]|nr:hypothetical protein LPJ75_000426 [Coemansia sp. RSA 2598]KAJ1828907.1 hypothetical protein LPJ56_000793 [Coemansia sp. RSA 2599]
MISESFVSQYVSFLFPEKAAELTAAPKGPDGQASNETKEARLALVYGDEESFGSGFWFLRHAIPDYFDKGIPKDDDPESFKEFVTKGIVVGEEDVPKRLALWDTVNKAFKA